MVERDADEGDEVQIFQYVGITLVIVDRPAEARGPCEGVLHDAAA